MKKVKSENTQKVSLVADNDSQIKAAAKQGAIQVIRAEDLATLEQCADEVKAAHADLGEKYLNLCKHIRAKQIPPTIVRETLAAKGFVKQRITEINRVAQCGDDVWNEFEARSLSFRKVLALERGTVEQLEPGASEATNNSGVDAGEPSEEDTAEALEDRKAKSLEQISRAATTILRNAADLEMRAKTWSIGNGYLLNLKKAPAVTTKLK